MRVPQLVVSDQKSTGVVELEKLDSQTRVAVRMPGATADYLRSNYPHLNLQGVPIERQALQLLLSQQASYAVVDEAQLGRLSAEPEFAGLVVVGDIGLPQLLRVATRRDWPELAGIVESAAGDPGQGPGAAAQPMVATQIPAPDRIPGVLAKPLSVVGGADAEQHGHRVLAASAAAQS